LPALCSKTDGTLLQISTSTVNITMDPQIEELLSLEAVRARAHAVLKLAEQGRLNHFDYHAERLEDATDYVLKLIQVRTRYDRRLAVQFASTTC
jgi:hypothetical protein